MIRRLIILLLIVGFVFSDNNTEITSVNNNEFVTIYYDDGSVSTHDTTTSACSISFGVEKRWNIECYMFADGNEENIIKAVLIEW